MNAKKLLFDQRASEWAREAAKLKLHLLKNCINNFPPPFIFIENMKKSFHLTNNSHKNSVCWNIKKFFIRFFNAKLRSKKETTTHTWHKHYNYLIFSPLVRCSFFYAARFVVHRRLTRFISFLVQDIEVDGSMISRSNNKVNETSGTQNGERAKGFFFMLLLLCYNKDEALGENAISTLHNA